MWVAPVVWARGRSVIVSSEPADLSAWDGSDTLLGHRIASQDGKPSLVVYTAILPVCETDAGLATVMGHEISHALAQHGGSQLDQVVGGRHRHDEPSVLADHAPELGHVEAGGHREYRAARRGGVWQRAVRGRW